MPGSGRGRTIGIWILAILITLAAVVYQRLIGPTRPVRGTATLDGIEIDYRLDRSHAGPEDHRLAIHVPAEAISGYIVYQRYKTDDPPTRIPLRRAGEELVAQLPHQPPGGKLVYTVHLVHTKTRTDAGIESIARTSGTLGGPTVIRFRGGVPVAVMIPHVLLMFLAMLWSNRAGLGALRGEAGVPHLTYLACGLLVAGGLVFGPLVQWHAFGEFWTGFPRGHDLTDNKTLIAALAWLGALLLVARRSAYRRHGVVAAALVTLVIFSIPHSVLGTELDYATLSAPADSLP